MFERRPKKSIDSNSVRTICGFSNDVVVYGLSSCQYEIIYDLLRLTRYQAYYFCSAYKAYHYNTLPFKLISPRYSNRAGTEISIKAECKTVLTNIILENYKRSLKGEPLIIVLFCVRFQNKLFYRVEAVNINKIATSHSSENQTIADGELRRCYKLCNDIGGVVSEIANKTIKFVKVIKDDDTYKLEVESPFWQNPAWKELWQTRKNNQAVDNTKPDSWRNALTNECEKIRSWNDEQENSDLNSFVM